MTLVINKEISHLLKLTVDSELLNNYYMERLLEFTIIMAYFLHITNWAMYA